MKRTSTSSTGSKNLVTLPKRDIHNQVTETSQIRRQSLPGPSTRSSTQKGKLNPEDVERDEDLEKQIILSLKKTPKEVTSVEGRVNIISQM